MKILMHTLASGLVAVAGLSAAAALASVNPELPPAHSAGPVTYLSGGSDPAQADALRGAASKYPVELEFLWGRGPKETRIAGVDWSIRKQDGRKLVDNAVADGPLVLASLPPGRYVVTATYDGKTLSRALSVRKGVHDDVVLEWPE